MTTELATIDAPEDLKASVAACVEWSRSNTVATAGAFEDTAAHLKAIKAQQKQADEFFDPPIKQAYELHKMLVGRKKIITDPLNESEKIDKQKMLGYQAAEEEKRIAEQRQLQAEADERARQERERLMKLEAKVKSPERKAAYAEQAAAVVAPVVQVPSSAPKLAGVAMKKVWRAEIVDRSAFMAFVHEQKRSDLVSPNEKVIDAYAKAMREAATMPGVRFFQETSLAAGRS